jgi:hypothetical protein
VSKSWHGFRRVESNLLSMARKLLSVSVRLRSPDVHWGTTGPMFVPVMSRVRKLEEPTMAERSGSAPVTPGSPDNSRSPSLVSPTRAAGKFPARPAFFELIVVMWVSLCESGALH